MAICFLYCWMTSNCVELSWLMSDSKGICVFISKEEGLVLVFLDNQTCQTSL